MRDKACITLSTCMRGSAVLCGRVTSGCQAKDRKGAVGQGVG
jgi:hypothetical protein